MFIEHIGIPATIELLSEEGAELSHACSKLARYIRGDNPVFKHGTDEQIVEGSDEEQKLYSNVEEEIADILVVADELMEAGVISPSSIESIYMEKIERIKRRSIG